MAISLVQTKTGTSVAASTVLTWSSNTSSGNLIVVAVLSSGALNNVSSITDSQGNTYTRINDAVSTVEVELWYARNITGGSTPTITVAYTASATNAAIAREYSGIDVASPLDQNVAATGLSNAPSSGNVTTAQARELLVAASGEVGTTGVYTAGSGFGNLATVDNTNRLAMEDQIVSSTGTYAGTFSLDSSQVWVANIATFKAIYEVSPSDNVSVAESLAHYSDQVDVMESRKLLLESNVSISNSATLTESLGILLDLNINKSDSITVSESLTAVIPININVSDSTTITESLQRLLESNISVAQNAMLSESVSTLVPTLLVSVSESISVSESLKFVLESSINKSDSVTVSESKQADLQIGVNVDPSNTAYRINSVKVI